MLIVVLTFAAIGFMPAMVTGAGVNVLVEVGASVGVDGTVGVNAGVAEAGTGVGDASVGVGETGVDVMVGVGEDSGVGVGVMNTGLPNSLHPRSGAAPVNPVSGLDGTGSPFAATY
jgi:hypothetical protein